MTERITMTDTLRRAAHLSRDGRWDKFKDSANAFDAWWRGLTRQGDPARRPDLTREAFHAGYIIARAELGADGEAEAGK